MKGMANDRSATSVPSVLTFWSGALAWELGSWSLTLLGSLSAEGLKPHPQPEWTLLPPLLS